MPKLKLIRGVVKDAKTSTVSEVKQYGSGKDASVYTETTNYTDVWLDVDGRDVHARAEAYLPFLPGHTAMFVAKHGYFIFLHNENSGKYRFVSDHLVRGQGAIMTTSLVIMIVGFVVFGVSQGAPLVVFYSCLMMLCPFVAGYFVWSARRKTRAAVWELTGKQPA